MVTPPLSGLERQEAATRLEAVDLELGNVTGTGLVDTQSHTPGAMVPVGTTVDVILVPPVQTAPS